MYNQPYSFLLELVANQWSGSSLYTHLFTSIVEVLDAYQLSTCVNSRAFASGSRVKIAGLPDRLSV